VRFDELKTTVQDVSKKSVQIHDLWKEFHKNLTSVDKIPSNIVDEITDPYESVARNLYSTRNESIPSLGKNFIELEKLTEEIGKTLDGEDFLQYDSIIGKNSDRIMLFSSNRLLK